MRKLRMSSTRVERRATTAHPSAPDLERVMPTAWLLVWTIYCVKLAMILAVFWATGTLEPVAMVTITTWFWLGPALAIAAGPAALRVRLLRLRRRRAALIASEWSVE